MSLIIAVFFICLDPRPLVCVRNAGLLSRFFCILDGLLVGPLFQCPKIDFFCKRSSFSLFREF